MVASTAAATRRHRDELVRRVGQAVRVADVFSAASTRLRRIVPFDGAAWVTTDPATGLPNGPTRLEDLEMVSPAQCSAHWRREFADADVNRFRELARAEIPAAGLRQAAGDPMGSRRYRTFLRPLGFDDELRAVLRVGDVPWGTVTLLRSQGQPAFTASEAALVASLSDPLGEAVRARSHDDAALDGAAVAADQPGLFVFDSSGSLLSSNEPALAWLAEVPPDRVLPTDHGLGVPLWLIVTVFHALAGGDGNGAARARVRTRSGAWLVCHATCLHSAGGAGGDVAVVIDRARPAQIAPIVVDAYDLTEREQQITSLIARGESTAAIAERLFVSTHTVRDHVKAILRKVAVTSRGELVAKLFAEHYEPRYKGQIDRRASAGR
jgi:DNA-binding CsgD family transcriptional regulator